MAWPPDPIAADKTNATVAEDDHAPHHNALAGAINDLVAFGPVASSLVDAKGDLIVASAANTVVRLPVGTDDHVLTADAAAANGVKWAAAAGGGGSDDTAQAAAGVAGGYVSGNWYRTLLNAADGSLSTGGNMLAAPVHIGKAVTIDRLAVQITNAGSASMGRMLIFEVANGVPGSLVVATAEADVSAPGRVVFTVSQALSAGTTYAIAYAADSSQSIRAGNDSRWRAGPFQVGASEEGAFSQTSFLSWTGTYSYSATAPSTFPTPISPVDNLPNFAMRAT